MADPPPYPGAPRWVKVSAAVLGLLLLVAVIVTHAGGGAGRNMRHGLPDTGPPTVETNP